MDGFEPILPGIMPLRRAGTGKVIGGLQIPDLDAPPPPPPEDVEAAEREAAAALERAEREAMLKAARAEGFAAGKEAGLAEAAASQQARIEEALAGIRAALGGAEVAALGAADAAAMALAQLLMAALDAALPAAAARLAPETAAGLVAMIRPVLEEMHGVTLHVAAGLGEACGARINDVRVEVLEDPALAPGDARAAWRSGGAVVELARQRALVAEVLTALGLEGN